MPWTSATIPKAAKTILKNLGAKPGSRLWRMWLHVANGCIKAGKLSEVRCIRSANVAVQREAKGDTMLEWVDLPEEARKAIQAIGGSSMTSEYTYWIRDYEYCKECGGTDEKCKEYATAWTKSRSKLSLPMPDGHKITITNSALIHNPVEFFEDEEMKIDEGTDSVTNKAVLMVPTIFTREGVMNTQFKPWDELETTFWTLERKPIIVPTHPEGGSPVTSQHIDRLVGYVSDIHLNSDDNSVRGFSNYFLDHKWVKENKDEIGTKQRNVSLGYYALSEDTKGSFNGVSYNAIDRSMYFDHNAHLVDTPAACPLPDCGLMLNSEGYAESIYTGGDTNLFWPNYIDSGTAFIPDVFIPDINVTFSVKETKEIVENKIEQARQILFDTGMFDDIYEIPEDMIAAIIVDGCCSDEDGRELTEGDQKFTFSPPWGSVNKSKLPRSAFAIKGDPDKKKTWKFPYKNPDGSINCGGVRAAKAALGGARTPAKISSADRSRLNKLFTRLWASCQRLRERQGDDKEQLGNVEESSKQLNTPKTVSESDNMAEDDEGQKPTEGTEGDTITPPVEPPVETPPVAPPVETPPKVEEIETKAPIADVESKLLASENVYLKKQIETLANEISELKDVETERRDAQVKSLRETVSKLNSDFQIFEKEEVEGMDEGELEKVVQAMQIKARPELREIFAQTVKKPAAIPYRSDEYAELTVFGKKEEGD